MVKGKIAIITDSSCDIPRDYLEEHNIFVLPLHINMPNGQNYLDGVNITPDEVYAGMPNVIPSTSQPAPEDIMQIFEKVKSAGYSEAIAVCISSGLSGTSQVMKLCAKEEKELTVHVFDSKRLSMALGLIVMQTVELVEKGVSVLDIINKLTSTINLTNGFFCIPTLTYLIKGGRIGRVAGTLGSLLGIVPIISINEEGHYFSEAKTRSYAIAIKKMIDRVREVVKGKIADIAVLQGGAVDLAKSIYDNLKNMEGLRNIFMCQVSPAMGVHTGPGLVGITYRIVNQT